MICFTGDTHNKTDAEKLNRKNFSEWWPPLSKQDCVIIAGDFGFIWQDTKRRLD